MARWYSRVTNDPSDLVTLLKCIEYFDAQYAEAQAELKPSGNISAWCTRIPGMVEYRYGQLQEVEAILAFYERRAAKVKLEKKRGFLEHYNRQLTDRQADQYAEIDDEVQVLLQLVEEIALIRNRFLGITKGLEYAHFQMGNITRLKAAGMEDACFTEYG